MPNPPEQQVSSLPCSEICFMSVSKCALSCEFGLKCRMSPPLTGTQLKDPEYPHGMERGVKGGVIPQLHVLGLWLWASSSTEGRGSIPPKP